MRPIYDKEGFILRSREKRFSVTKLEEKRRGSMSRGRYKNGFMSEGSSEMGFSGARTRRKTRSKGELVKKRETLIYRGMHRRAESNEQMLVWVTWARWRKNVR
ncbi:hypothetical protein Csa_020304 [Cucumis sativus]|uniref:Uncharacterized protein n=1 Tax=Cucumis sativus TaxID=3659 RepID=A0A0A0K5Q6_CUCSA|nr:hypothetical protein Csa_020304 [Cucumis sativus]